MGRVVLPSLGPSCWRRLIPTRSLHARRHQSGGGKLDDIVWRRIQHPRLCRDLCCWKKPDNSIHHGAVSFLFATPNKGFSSPANPSSSASDNKVSEKVKENPLKSPDPSKKTEVKDTQIMLMIDPKGPAGTRLDRMVDRIIYSKYKDKPVPAAVRIVQNLVHYLWPEGQPGLRARVVASLSFLVVAKLVNIQVPMFFKYVIDALTFTAATPEAAAAAAVGVPVSVVLCYGLARGGAAALGELRSALFAKVAQRAIRQISVRVFENVHKLDLAYHLSRQTGSVSRTIERGTRGVNFALNSLLFNIIPTSIEIALVSGILTYSFGASFGAIALLTVGSYGIFTVEVSKTRQDIRRHMNKMENEASAKVSSALCVCLCVCIYMYVYIYIYTYILIHK
jgi:hypothetical protein